MKAPSISRRMILPAIVIAVLLLSLPGSIHRFLETGDVYLFSARFFDDMLARLAGPGRLRFIFQPLVAITLGIRHGVKDAHRNIPPFLWALAFHGSHRTVLLKDAAFAVSNIVCLAILLEVISQLLIFKQVNPGAALILGPVLISLPYGSARGLANRVVRSRSGNFPMTKVG
jgi:hypothetical protein